MKVAIVGAGMAGAACARALADAGIDGAAVRQGPIGRRPAGAAARRAGRVRPRRPVSGRTATRRSRPRSMAGAAGASWRTGRAWRAPPATPVLVGVPSMNAPVKALLADLPVAHGAAGSRRSRHATGGWSLVGRGWPPVTGHSPPWSLAVPAPQAVALLATAGEGFGGGPDPAPGRGSGWPRAGRHWPPSPRRSASAGRRCGSQDGPLAWAGAQCEQAGPWNGRNLDPARDSRLVEALARARARRHRRRRCSTAFGVQLGRAIASTVLPRGASLALRAGRAAVGRALPVGPGLAPRPVRGLVPGSAGRGRLPVRHGAGGARGGQPCKPHGPTIDRRHLSRGRQACALLCPVPDLASGHSPAVDQPEQD